MIPTILTGAAGLFLLFALGWAWGMRTRNAGVVDVLWAYSLAGLVAWYAVRAEGDGGRALLLALATGFWGIRLSTHILARQFREKSEDRRYAALRAHWGDSANWKFFFFFQGQALANLILAAPILLLLSNRAPLAVWDFLGVAVVVLSVVGERLADRQLDAWKADPANRGKTCRRGLWAWSRHPNYFFEWTHWLAYPLMGGALFASGLGAWWPLTLLGPAVMLALLLRGTGIPHTEWQALKSRGDDYRRYQQEVSAFIPWPPSRSRQNDSNPPLPSTQSPHLR